MEENPGWHHEDALLQAVIDHRMTDASPLRALKIALGKQRDSIFTQGRHGYWKLVSDETAGPLPQPMANPTVRQLILARERDQEAARTSEGGESRDLSGSDGQHRSRAGARDSKSERWRDVSNDEVARARRNLLGLGSTP